MPGNGKQESSQTSYLFNQKRDLGPVFPGKPHLNNQANPTNLAVKRSLVEIFDEFTDVISGELKSMNLEQVEPKSKKQQ